MRTTFSIFKIVFPSNSEVWLKSISTTIRNCWLANGKKAQVQNKHCGFATFWGFIVGITITSPFTPNTQQQEFVHCLKLHKENKNVSPQCSTTSKKIKMTRNTFFAHLSVLTGWGPDSWVLKVWGCQNCFCLSLIITHPKEHVVYCLMPGLQC